MPASGRIHVAHVIYSLCIGGLENGLVNLINRLPPERYRHTVLCLTDHTSFVRRIRRDDVDVVDFHKRPGHDWRAWRALHRWFRTHRPDVVHTRNLAALETQPLAWLAGIGARIHGEHGWSEDDPGGVNPRYRLQRRLLRPFVQRYIALSRPIEAYLRSQIGVRPSRIHRIINGVDTERFRPDGPAAVLPEGFSGAALRIGTVGRLDPVKDQSLLVRAFARLSETGRAADARLILVGDGPERERLRALVADLGLEARVWFAGARDDVPELMRALDLFVLPSRAEGISNTIMEAMACGLPVVATRVGGNFELVREGENGALVPANDVDALADALSVYLEDRERCRAHGRAGRRLAEQVFSLQVMVDRYDAVYRECTEK